MDNKNQIVTLLTSSQSRLLIMREEYINSLLSFFPLNEKAAFFDDPKTYSEEIKEEFVNVRAEAAVPLAIDYGSGNIEPDSLAYHRILGLITADSKWYFSSKQMEKNLIMAENNPNIIAHFLHVTSGGGEAWYLDRLAETLRSLSKPVYTLIEKVCGSAAYYIACHAAKMTALTQNDIVGCIGAMIGFWDIEPYFESLGFKKIEEYASISDLKNKKYNDLKAGKPAQFITEELDPLALQFRDEVRRTRKSLASLELDHPALRGETFDAINSIEVGLIDGIATFREATSEAYELGMKWRKSQQQRNKILSLI